ncbi:MAG: hypothetical protein E7417_00660 [Ruminococcaceae bacterium]|nr:hypothetical protein [Oscillospiraceae bacterium]
MSINLTQQIKCPACQNLQEITLWQSITPTDSPDLKEDLLKGKINIFRCTSCGQIALVPMPVLYHDDKKKLMISFTPCEDDAKRVQLFNEIKATSKKSGELESLEDYNLRFVWSYNDFLEKILIFDNGLHDKVIELLKLLVLMQDTDNMPHRTCMFGKLDEDEIEFLVQDKKEEKLYTSRIPMSTYETVHTQLKQSGIKYKSFDWEMVDSDYASRMLYGMNNNL